MKHTKIFKTEDKTRYEIMVEINGAYSGKPICRLEVLKCEPGKRKFTCIAPEFSDDWRYRMLSKEEQHDFRKREFMKEVRQEWVEETLDELLVKMRNEFINKWGK